MIKRYMVFGYDHYESNGGLSDLRSSYDTIEDLKKDVKRISGSSNYYYEIGNESFNDFDAIEIFDRIEGIQLNKKEILG